MKFSAAIGQQFRYIITGRNTLAGGLTTFLRQAGRDYLDQDTADVWNEPQTFFDLGLAAGNAWETVASAWFTVQPCSGTGQGTSPFINTDIEFRLTKTGAGTADVSFIGIQKRGAWELFVGGLANTYRFPIGSRVDGQDSVSKLYSSTTGPKDDIQDLTAVPNGADHENLATGEWNFEFNTLTSDGGWVYYRLNGGETIGGMWFIPFYGSKQEANVTCTGSGDISNITTYGGKRGIVTYGIGTSFTGSNIHAFIANANAIGARIDSDFVIDVATAGTDDDHSKGFMGDRGGRLTIHRGDTRTCYDNAYQVFAGDPTTEVYTRSSALTMTACRVSAEYSLEPSQETSGAAVNAESPLPDQGVAGLGYDLIIANCILPNIGDTGIVYVFKKGVGSGDCNVDIQNTVAVNNTTSRGTVNIEDGIVITGSLSRWGGTSSGNDSVVASATEEAAFRATGEFTADINDQFTGGDPLTDIIPNSTFIGLGPEVLFTDFYGRDYLNPSTLGGYAFIFSGSPILSTPYSIELTANESAFQATNGTVSTVVANKMKIFLGSSVDMQRRGSIVGTLTSCFNELMVQAARGADTSTNTKVSRGNYLTGTSATITVEAVTSNIAVTDVAIVVAGDFGSEINQTTMYKETFRKLIGQILERSTGN